MLLGHYAKPTNKQTIVEAELKADETSWVFYCDHGKDESKWFSTELMTGDHPSMLLFHWKLIKRDENCCVIIYAHKEVAKLFTNLAYIASHMDC